MSILQSSGIAAIILAAEDGIVARPDIVGHRKLQLTQTGTEQFDTNLVTLRSYGYFAYDLLLPHGTDGSNPILTPSNVALKQLRAPQILPSTLYAYQLF